MKPIEKLTSLGQSLWYDNIQRKILENGEFKAMIERGDIRGVTSNPTISITPSPRPTTTTRRSLRWRGQAGMRKRSSGNSPSKISKPLVMRSRRSTKNPTAATATSASKSARISRTIQMPQSRKPNNSGRGWLAKISWSKSPPPKRASLPFAKR